MEIVLETIGDIMGERYWITGVQLGLLKSQKSEQLDELVVEIIDNQFIGNFRTDKDKKRFEEQIKLVQ